MAYLVQLLDPTNLAKSNVANKLATCVHQILGKRSIELFSMKLDLSRFDNEKGRQIALAQTCARDWLAKNK